MKLNQYKLNWNKLSQYYKAARYFLKLFFCRSFSAGSLKAILIATVFCSYALTTLADDLIERVVELESKEKNAVLAKKEILEEAILKTSENLVEELVGEAKSTRNKILIQNKILKNSARFIPYTKTGELIALNAFAANTNASVSGAINRANVSNNASNADSNFKMAVTLKIKIDELKKLLLENGLFYENDGSPIVVTFIKWIDGNQDQGYSWWLEEASTKSMASLMVIEKAFETYLKSSLQKNYFYLIRPAAFNYQYYLDKPTGSDLVSLSDMQSFAQNLGAQIIIKGQVLVKGPQLHFDLEGLQVQNLRAIAQVSRKFPIEKNKEAFEVLSQELSSQILEAWQKGSLGASLYRLSFTGRMPPLARENIKDFFKTKLKELKNMKERYLEYSKLTYDIEASQNPMMFKEKLPQFDYMGLHFVIESANEKEAQYKIQ